jgi:two-component system LytT family response regulator
MTTKIRTLVVDDEPVGRARVVSLLRGEIDFEIVGECSTAPEAASAIEKTSPDLVFLDIEMPNGNGVDLVRRLSGSMPAVVFVTAYDEYALRAFEVHALDYLLKPFSAERFRSALTHVRQQFLKRHAGEGGAADHPPDVPRSDPPRRERLVIKSSGRITFVRVQDIDWCEAAGNYVRLHAGAQTHFVRGTMNRLEAQLDPSQFVRVHRSTIVNVDRVQELRSSFNGEYVIQLNDGTRLTLSRGYRDVLQARLGRAL